MTEQGTSDALAITNASARGAAERAMAARAAAAEAEARLAEHLSAAASCAGRLRLRDFVGSSAAPNAPSSRSHTHTNTHSTAKTNTKADSDPDGRRQRVWHAADGGGRGAWAAQEGQPAADHPVLASAVPAAQLTHAAEAETAWYWPARQLWQRLDEGAPVDAEKVPAGQLVHTAAPVASW